YRHCAHWRAGDKRGFFTLEVVWNQPSSIAHPRLQAPHIVPRWVVLFIGYASPLYYRITIQRHRDRNSRGDRDEIGAVREYAETANTVPVCSRSYECCAGGNSECEKGGKYEFMRNCEGDAQDRRT